MGFGVSGLVIFAIAALFFWIAVPRHGEVVGFLRGKANVQAAYGLLVTILGTIGVVMMIFGAAQ